MHPNSKDSVEIKWKSVTYPTFWGEHGESANIRCVCKFILASARRSLESIVLFLGPQEFAVLKMFFSVLLRLPLYFSLARSHVDQYLMFP